VPLLFRDTPLGFLLLHGAWTGTALSEQLVFLQTIQTILTEEVANAVTLSRLLDLKNFNAAILEQIQSGVGHLVDQVKPLHEARTEMDVLRRRLDELERSLAQIEDQNGTRKTRARSRGSKRVG